VLSPCEAGRQCTNVVFQLEPLVPHQLFHTSNPGETLLSSIRGEDDGTRHDDWKVWESEVEAVMREMVQRVDGGESDL